MAEAMINVTNDTNEATNTFCGRYELHCGWKRGASR